MSASSAVSCATSSAAAPGREDPVRTATSRSSRPGAAAEDVAQLTALDADIAGVALRAFVDHGGLGERDGKHDEGIDRGLAAEAVATLAAGVRAPDATPVGDEGEPAGGAGALAANRNAVVTQRGCPPARDGAWRGP